MKQRDEIQFGASLSIKQCRNFKIDDQKVLQFALKELQITRFRLMSYWNEIEIKPGAYNFDYLDAQVAAISKNSGSITMCIGVRQPRWPESHWPSWTNRLSISERNNALYRFIETTVRRYQKNVHIVSWQLENEALLKNFGEQGDFDRKRLRSEYAIIKQLDSSRPIIMTTSTSWGIPLRRPIPDVVGFSYYLITYDKGAYRKSIYQPWIFKLRSTLIRLLWRRPSFIHELQAEPWGPKNIWEMSDAQQAESMNLQLLTQNIQMAKKIGLYPIDFWGLEWWYWLYTHKKTSIADFVQTTLSDNTSK